MKSRRRSHLFRQVHRYKPEKPPAEPLSEREIARRAARDFLRERDETNVVEFEGDDGIAPLSW